MEACEVVRLFVDKVVVPAEPQSREPILGLAQRRREIVFPGSKISMVKRAEPAKAHRTPNRKTAKIKLCTPPFNTQIMMTRQQSERWEG